MWTLLLWLNSYYLNLFMLNNRAFIEVNNAYIPENSFLLKNSAQRFVENIREQRKIAF